MSGGLLPSEQSFFPGRTNYTVIIDSLNSGSSSKQIKINTNFSKFNPRIVHSFDFKTQHPDKFLCIFRISIQQL